jgi:hypothetical protein
LVVVIILSAFARDFFAANGARRSGVGLKIQTAVNFLTAATALS